MTTSDLRPVSVDGQTHSVDLSGYTGPAVDVGASAGGWVYALWCREDPHLHLHGSLFEVHPSNFDRLRDKYGHCYEPVRRWVGEWEPVEIGPANDIDEEWTDELDH